METTSSQIEQVDDNFVQPVGTQLDVIATKDEQIKALITSVQDLKQQLEHHITANETRFKTLEDGLDVTRHELNATTITGRQMKDELTKQCEEHFKAFEKLLSSSSHGLNEELITNIPAIVTNIQNDEKMNNILEEVTKIKQEVITTQQNLEMTKQKFEKELTTVKGEIQSCHSEARKAKDNHTQSLKSMQAKLTTSQLVSQHKEGKVSGKLTQEIKNIKNIKQNLSETNKLFNQKLKCAKEDITAIREEMKKSHEELSVVKQKQVMQVAALATSHNKWKENLNLISNFVIIVIFAVLVLAASFSPYSMFCDVNNITEEFNISCQHLMRNISVDLMSNISYDQGIQIQRLNDTLNAMQLQIESESELVAKLHKNISGVNQTTLSIVNGMKAHYNHEIKEISTLVTDLSLKVNTFNNDQVLQLQKLAGIEEDLNITRSRDLQSETRITELVTELHKNISAVNETALDSINELKAQQITLHCFSGYQYQKELTIKALQLEKLLAKVNDPNASFPVIVMISGISSMVNNMHAHNNNNYYHWANASVNIGGELLYVSLQKIDNAHFKVILCEPLPIWCNNLILRNQINDSSNYKIGKYSMMNTDQHRQKRIARIKNKEEITGCLSYSSINITKLLKITSDCQYVVCDRIFISMKCEFLNPN